MTYPKFFRGAEVLVGKQLVEFVASLDTVTLVSILSTEDLRNIGKVPGLDVIVTLVPSVDVALDGVALVADHKSRSTCISMPCSA